MSDALDGGENRTHSVSMAYHEFTQMELVAIVCARDAEIERLRDGLFLCAKHAGEDVSDGPPTWPHIVEWAARAVVESRADNEDEEGRLRDIIARAAALAEREDYETPVAAVLKEGL